MDIWAWTNKGALKERTESLIFAAQEKVFRTNYIKYHINESVDSTQCIMYGKARGDCESHRKRMRHIGAIKVHKVIRQYCTYHTQGTM